MLLQMLLLPSVISSYVNQRLSKQELAFVGKAIDDFISDFDHSIEKKNRQLLRMLGKMGVRSVEGEASAHELIESWMKGMKAAFEVRLNAVTEDLKERVLIECVDVPAPNGGSSDTDLDELDSSDLLIGGQCLLRKPHDPPTTRPRRVVPGTRIRERIVIRDDLNAGGGRSYSDYPVDYRHVDEWGRLSEVDDYRGIRGGGGVGGRHRSNRYDDLYRKRELERERELRRLEARLSRLRGLRRK